MVEAGGREDGPELGYLRGPLDAAKKHDAHGAHSDVHQLDTEQGEREPEVGADREAQAAAVEPFEEAAAAEHATQGQGVDDHPGQGGEHVADCE